jgi:hypothetical protein
MGDWGGGFIGSWVINKTGLQTTFGTGIFKFRFFPIVPYLEPYPHAAMHPFNMIIPNPPTNDQ